MSFPVWWSGHPDHLGSGPHKGTGKANGGIRTLTSILVFLVRVLLLSDAYTAFVAMPRKPQTLLSLLSSVHPLGKVHPPRPAA